MTGNEFAQRYYDIIAAIKKGNQERKPLRVYIFWNYDITTVAELRKWFISRLNEKINTKGGVYAKQTGRKYGDIYQADLMRDCRAIRERVNSRVALHQITTPELKKRFSHLIFSEY